MSASIGQPPAIVAAILFLAFFAQAIKEIGIPSPGLTQSLLLYAGYQFSHSGFLFGIGIVLLTCVGSLSGAILIFCLAKYGGSRLLAKLNQYSVIKPDKVEKARKKISAYSFFSVVTGRSIPGLMAPTSLVAGSLKMPMRKFLPGVIFSLTIWIVFLITLGGTFSHFTPQLSYNPGIFLIPLGALTALAILASALHLRKVRPDLKSDQLPPILIQQAKEDE